MKIKRFFYIMLGCGVYPIKDYEETVKKSKFQYGVIKYQQLEKVEENLDNHASIQ